MNAVRDHRGPARRRPRRQRLRRSPSRRGRSRYEQRAFWRNRTRAFFSFGIPLMLLLLFGSLNQRRPHRGARQHPLRTFFLPGILAYGIVITPFMNMAGRPRHPARQRAAQAHAGHAAAGWAFFGGRVGSTVAISRDHDRRHARARRRRLRRAPRAEAIPGGVPHRPARRGHASRRWGSPPVPHHPQRRGRAGGGQRADPAAHLHLGHLVPDDQRPRVAAGRGARCSRSSGWRAAARRLRPAQPRARRSRQRPALGWRLWLAIGVRAWRSRFWRKETAR